MSQTTKSLAANLCKLLKTSKAKLKQVAISAQGADDSTSSILTAIRKVVAHSGTGMDAKGDKWITVHPNGKGNGGGTAALIGADGTIKAGMGGKFNGKNIKDAHGTERFTSHETNAETEARHKEESENKEPQSTNSEAASVEHPSNIPAQPQSAPQEAAQAVESVAPTLEDKAKQAAISATVPIARQVDGQYTRELHKSGRGYHATNAADLTQTFDTQAKAEKFLRKDEKYLPELKPFDAQKNRHYDPSIQDHVYEAHGVDIPEKLRKANEAKESARKQDEAGNAAGAKYAKQRVDETEHELIAAHKSGDPAKVRLAERAYERAVEQHHIEAGSSKEARQIALEESARIAKEHSSQKPHEAISEFVGKPKQSYIDKMRAKGMSDADIEAKENATIAQHEETLKTSPNDIAAIGLLKGAHNNLAELHKSTGNEEGAAIHAGKSAEYGAKHRELKGMPTPSPQALAEKAHAERVEAKRAANAELLRENERKAALKANGYPENKVDTTGHEKPHGEHRIVRETENAYAVENPEYAEAMETALYDVKELDARQREVLRSKQSLIWIPKSHASTIGEGDNKQLATLSPWIAKAKGIDTHESVARASELEKTRAAIESGAAERYANLVKHAKANGLTGVRVGMRTSTILDKMKEAGIEPPESHGGAPKPVSEQSQAKPTESAQQSAQSESAPTYHAIPNKPHKGAILNVPFSEKDAAKQHGARWSPDLKKWYVPEGVDFHPDLKKYSASFGTDSADKPRITKHALRIALLKMKRHQGTGMDKRDVEPNGFITVYDNPISMAGVYDFRGSQLPNAPDKNKIYKVYRPSEELQKQACIDSFKLQPIIIIHKMIGDEALGLTPLEKVGGHGTIGEQVYFKTAKESGLSEDALFSNLKFWSSRSTDKIKEQERRGQKQDLSVGYDCFYTWKKGVYKGQPYDCIQTELRGNHIAMVDDGRMGKEVSVVD